MGYLSVIDALKIKGKTVDDAAIGNDKILIYKTTGDKLVYETKPSGGGGSKSFLIPPEAMNLESGGDYGGIKSRCGCASTITSDDNKLTGITTNFIIPADYSSGLAIKLIWKRGMGSGAGNMYAKSKVEHDAAGGGWNSGSVEKAYAAYAVETGTEALTFSDLTPSLSGLAAGRFVGVQIIRNAFDALDTMDAGLDFLGILIEYTAA